MIERLPTGTAESDGVRHAALLLHAMAEVDRTWLLKALPAVQRAELQRLLAELDSLGIACEPGLVDDLRGVADQASSTHAIDDFLEQATPPSDPEALGQIDEGEIQMLVHRLRGEPAGLVAQLLVMGPWPWRDRVFDALDPDHRQRVHLILSAAGGSVLPRALGDALIGALMRDVRQSARPASRPLRPMQRLARRLAFFGLRQGDTA